MVEVLPCLNLSTINVEKIVFIGTATTRGAMNILKNILQNRNHYTKTLRPGSFHFITLNLLKLSNFKLLTFFDIFGPKNKIRKKISKFVSRGTF